MPVCQEHSVSLSDGQIVAVDRVDQLDENEHKNLKERSPERFGNNRGDGWVYSNRRSWYRSFGYTPYYWGHSHYGNHRYDDYDVRSFDDAGTGDAASDIIEGEEATDMDSMDVDGGSLYDS